jgi:hypothetical protein
MRGEERGERRDGPKERKRRKREREGEVWSVLFLWTHWGVAETMLNVERHGLLI